MKIKFTLLIVLTFSFLTSAQQTDTFELESEKTVVKNLVEQFITAAGNYDLEAIPAMFSDKANIYGASIRGGKWNTYTMTIQDFLECIKTRDNEVDVNCVSDLRGILFKQNSPSH